MRDAIRLALEGADDIDVVGETDNGTRVVPLVGRVLPDLVLLDMCLPGADGLVCLEQLRERHPTVKVVILSALDDADRVAAALRRGACGYILKSINPADLPSTIRQAVEGSFFSVALPEAEPESPADVRSLSPKELVVLRELALGLGNREIAAKLWLSEQTVKFHLRNIYRKLGVSKRTEALRYAHLARVVETPVFEPV
jgi:DNA-binding NarL/FixJ family response regulator